MIRTRLRARRSLIIELLLCGFFPIHLFPAQARFTVSDAATSLWVSSEPEAESRAKGAAIEKLRISCRFEAKVPQEVRAELADYSVQNLRCDRAYRNSKLLYSCKAEAKGVCESGFAPGNADNSSPKKTAQTGGISGSIVLGDSSPCVHCDVWITGPSSPPTSHITTDTQGKFQYLGLPPGEYYVQYSDPTGKQWANHTAVVAGSVATFTMDYSKFQWAQGSGEITGNVRLDGRPCSACTVSIRPAERNFGTETDSQGNFHYHLPAGEWVLSIQSPDGKNFKTPQMTKGMDEVPLRGQLRDGMSFDLDGDHYFVAPGLRAKADVKLISGSGNCLQLTRPITFEGKPTQLLQCGEGCPPPCGAAPRGSSGLVEANINDLISKGPHQDLREPQVVQAAPAVSGLVQSNIDRISTGPHQNLPEPQVLQAAPGQGTGWDIKNETRYLLHIYLAGAVSEELEIQPGSSKGVDFPPGNYRLAADVPDPSVIPFYAVRALGANTRWRSSFYIK